MTASIMASTAACSPVKNEQSSACSRRRILPRMVPRASWARALGSRCPATSASSMSRPEAPWISEITDDSFRCPSSSSFSTRCFSAVRAWVMWRRYRVWVRSRRIGAGGTKLEATEPRSVILASHTASARSVLGRPGRALTCAALYSWQSNPRDSRTKNAGFQSGSGGALLRRRPLGTGHARFPGNRLGQALEACWSGLRKCWFTAGAVWEAASAVGVDEAGHGGSALDPGPRVEGDRLVAGRRADGFDPLLPFVRVLGFSVGVQEQLPAKRAASMLPFEEPQPGRVERGCPASPPGCPVSGQGGVVG